MTPNVGGKVISNPNDVNCLLYIKYTNKSDFIVRIDRNNLNGPSWKATDITDLLFDSGIINYPEIL